MARTGPAPEDRPGLFLETTMHDRFLPMTTAQLVSEFNAMADRTGGKVRPVQKFESREVGLRRCERLRTMLYASECLRSDGAPDFMNRAVQDEAQDPPIRTNPRPADGTDPVPLTAEQVILREADRRWRSWLPTAHERVRPRISTFIRIVRGERVSLDTASNRKRGLRVIRVKVDKNPHREGTDAHRHFEAMVGGPTVNQYLAGFSDKVTASRWLTNDVRSKFVELLG